MTDYYTIVVNLTEPQKKMLRELRNGQPKSYALGMAGFALVDKNLAFINELGAKHLTDLGHAVYKFLGDEL